MRLLLFQVRLQGIQRIDLVEQLELRLDAVERRAGVDAQSTVEEGTAIPQQWVGELYPIIMEALNDSLKHARATQVRVVLSGDADHIVVEVVDNGAGFDPTLVPPGGMRD